MGKTSAVSVLIHYSPEAITVPHQIIWSWYTGRWRVGSYIWYSEEGTGRGPSPPRPLLTLPNVTAHPSTVSVLITVLLYNGPLLCGFNVKVKVWTLAIAPLTWVRLVTSSALQSRKWQLIGMSQWFRSALCGHPLPALTNNWTHGAASRHTIAPISHTRPSPRSRSYYSFPVPLRVGGWRLNISKKEQVLISKNFNVDTYHKLLIMDQIYCSYLQT